MNFSKFLLPEGRKDYVSIYIKILPLIILKVKYKNSDNFCNDICLIRELKYFF